MLVAAILVISVAVVMVAVGIDVGCQVLVEKKAERFERKTQQAIRNAKRNEALMMLRQGIAKKLETTIELNVVSLPVKKFGKHRLVAA